MDINKIVDIGAGMCFEIVLRDDIWRSFSYKGKPRRGKIFNSLIPKRQLATELFLIQELICLNFAIIFKALYSNYFAYHNKLDFDEWKIRGTMNEGPIVIGILERIWHHKVYENLDDFINQIIISVRKYQIESFEENVNYFVDRFSEVNTHLSKEIILFGSIYLFRASNFARTLNAKVKEDRDFFSSNPPKGKLNISLGELETKKLIDCSLILLELK